MIDIQLFVGCDTCGWQQGCPREDLPPSALEGGACEAGGPGPHGGFLLCRNTASLFSGRASDELSQSP